MNTGRRQMMGYGAACAVAGVGFFAIASKCAHSPPTSTNQSTVHPAKRERPPRQPSKPQAFEAAGASETEIAWNDPQSKREVRVRRTLVMTATPNVREEVARATAEIALDFREGADLWDESQKGWRPMDEAELGRWFESMPNHTQKAYSTTASITKVIDDASGEPGIESVSAFGTARDDPKRDWSMAENGMLVYLDWKDDQLVVKWSGRVELGVEPITRTVDIPFPERFATQEQ